MKKVCQLDEAGFYVGQVDADESPLEEGVYLIPGGAVDFKAPSVPDGSRAKWNGSGFDIELIPEPTPTDQEVPVVDRAAEIKEELQAIDAKSIRPIREGDAARIADLEAQAAALREELRSL